jgi:hypothetical protein
MASATRHLTVVEGGADDPLRVGICRRHGCAETVTELGLCTDHLQGYNRMRGRREQALARRAAANYETLVESAARDVDQAGRPDVERDWLWALGEHLAAHGVDADTVHDEDLLRQAVLDALGDYVDEHAGRGHLSVVA